MTIRSFSDEDVRAIKAKGGLDRLVEGEIQMGATAIRLLLAPLTEKTLSDFVDKAFTAPDAAKESLLYRAIRFHSAAELGEIRKGCLSLPSKVFDILAGDAGMPIAPPARYDDEEELSATTPPLVLELAGLDEGTVQQLLAQLAGRPARVVTLYDQEDAPIFSAVISPGEAEDHILRKARAEQRGYLAAARSALAGSLRWSSAPLPDICKRYPAIPWVFADTIGTMGGAAATRSFRVR
jgi:hypothetical protein